LIVERTQAGMTEARKARKLIEAGERVEDVAALWNVGRTTLYLARSLSEKCEGKGLNGVWLG
jgi:hypothetical protein